MDDCIDVYGVKMLDRAFRDLDGIYDYIASTLLEPEVVPLKEADLATAE